MVVMVTAFSAIVQEILYVGDHVFGDVIKAKKEQAWRWESGSTPLEIVWYKKTGGGGDRGEGKGEGGRVWKGERGNKEARREGGVGRGEKKEREERKSFEGGNWQGE